MLNSRAEEARVLRPRHTIQRAGDQATAEGIREGIEAATYQGGHPTVSTGRGGVKVLYDLTVDEKKMPGLGRPSATCRIWPFYGSIHEYNDKCTRY